MSVGDPTGHVTGAFEGMESESLAIREDYYGSAFYPVIAFGRR